MDALELELEPILELLPPPPQAVSVVMNKPQIKCGNNLLTVRTEISLEKL